MKLATESGFRKRLEPSLQLSFFVVKSSMVDVRLGSKYASGEHQLPPLLSLSLLL